MALPIFPFTATVTSSYVSGSGTNGTVYVGVKAVASASFELVNFGNPTVLFAIDASLIPALTGTLSASYSRSLNV